MGNSNQKDVWKEFYKAAEDDTKQLSTETLRKLSSGELNPADKTAIRAFARRKQEELVTKNREIVEKLWNIYDADHNGELSKVECRLLLKDNIEQAKIFMPALMQSVTNEQLRLVQNGLAEPNLAKAFDSIRPKVSRVIEEGVSRALQRLVSTDSLSDDLYKKMDENHDGHVSKDEFLRNYLKASQEVINNDTMMEELNASVTLCVTRELTAFVTAAGAAQPANRASSPKASS